MDGRDAASGRGTLVERHVPRTYGIPPPRGLVLAGMWLMACAGVAFGLDAGVLMKVARLFYPVIGLAFFVWGVAMWARGARITREIVRAGPSPWTARGLWNAAASRLAGPLEPRHGPRPMDVRTRRLLMCMAALVLVFVAPNWKWRGVVVVAFLICDELVRPRNAIATRVAFGSFPMLAGDRARFSVTFVRRPPADPFDTVAFTLRCITETPRLRGAIWPVARCVLAIPPVSAARATADGGPLDVEFEVPADAPGTDLLSRPAVYWELVVQGTSPSWSYEQAFQVPVYARAPASGVHQPTRRLSDGEPGRSHR